MNTDYQILAFENAPAWREWLDKHHSDTNGVWLRIYKKNSGVPTVSYASALDESLCYGWIDGQKKKYDELSFLQKFTPRRSKSLWSKRNIEHIARLTKSKLMMPAGIAEVERAKADGRWEAAYDAPSTMVIPDDFLEEVTKNEKTLTFFNTFNKSERYAIAWRLQTAKTPETRDRRFNVLLAKLKNHKKP